MTWCQKSCKYQLISLSIDGLDSSLRQAPFYMDLIGLCRMRSYSIGSLKAPDFKTHAVAAKPLAWDWCRARTATPLKRPPVSSHRSFVLLKRVQRMSSGHESVLNTQTVTKLRLPAGRGRGRHACTDLLEASRSDTWHDVAKPCSCDPGRIEHYAYWSSKRV